ncbi:integrase core domain-containing protein [bacterium]|nr:integrase core domain-containing protein [bacterium]
MISPWRAGASVRTTFSSKRLWQTLKYQYIYLHSFDMGQALRKGLALWFRYYNQDRGHSSLDDKTPDEVYNGLPHPYAEAA